jgi:hypothetical protein
LQWGRSTFSSIYKEKEGEEMIVDKLAKIVGAGNVIQEPGMLDQYSRDISFVNLVRPTGRFWI